MAVNGRTNTRTAKIRVEGEPGGTAVNQQTNTIYVTSSGQVFVVNGKTNTVSGPIQLTVNGIAVR